MYGHIYNYATGGKDVNTCCRNEKVDRRAAGVWKDIKHVGNGGGWGRTECVHIAGTRTCQEHTGYKLKYEPGWRALTINYEWRSQNGQSVCQHK